MGLAGRISPPPPPSFLTALRPGPQPQDSPSIVVGGGVLAAAPRPWRCSTSRSSFVPYHAFRFTCGWFCGEGRALANGHARPLPWIAVLMGHRHGRLFFGQKGTIEGRGAKLRGSHQ